MPLCTSQLKQYIYLHILLNCELIVYIYNICNIIDELCCSIWLDISLSNITQQCTFLVAAAEVNIALHSQQEFSSSEMIRCLRKLPSFSEEHFKECLLPFLLFLPCDAMHKCGLCHHAVSV